MVVSTRGGQPSSPGKLIGDRRRTLEMLRNVDAMTLREHESRVVRRHARDLVLAMSVFAGGVAIHDARAGRAFPASRAFGDFRLPLQDARATADARPRPRAPRLRTRHTPRGEASTSPRGRCSSGTSTPRRLTVVAVQGIWCHGFQRRRAARPPSDGNGRAAAHAPTSPVFRLEPCARERRGTTAVGP